MYFNTNNNKIHTILKRSCSRKTISESQQEQYLQPVNKKVSMQTLDTLHSSRRSTSIKSLAKGVMTSIADSGVSISRSGSFIVHHQDHLIKYYNTEDSILSDQCDEEVDRMVSQHYILRTAFNDVDYSAPVTHLLSQQDDDDKAIVLDMGCGSGTWTMEMATQFPHAKFIGIDKKSLFPSDIRPRNCQFQVYDITAGHIVNLPFADCSVDYIFQRDLNWGLTEEAWLPLVQEYFRILKPGGWIEIVEPDFETHSGSTTYEDVLVNKLLSAFYRRHQDPFVAKRLSSFMASAGFRRIQSDFKSIPLGWGYQKLFRTKTQKTTQKCSEYARAAANHRLELLKSLQPWFTRENHISKHKYETLINQLPEKWHQSKAYTNWHRSTAQKPFFLNHNI